MQKHARLIDFVLPRHPSPPDGHAVLFDELLAACVTACALDKPVIAEGLLTLLDLCLDADELMAPADRPRLERLVEARYRVLEVKFQLRQTSWPAG